MTSNTCNKRRKWDYTSHTLAYYIYMCLYCLMCKHKISTWGKTDDTMLFYTIHFSAHLYTFFYNINFIYDTISHAVRRTSLNAIVVMLRIDMQEQKILNIFMITKVRWKNARNSSLFWISWQRSHGISHECEHARMKSI